ncbi:MAG: heat-inducible transcriptional repressor HrcA, partial [Gammaproteobacteria bacterium]|nr:heat-inducible transcriptional repressor HrcA [Gammaproteobacteria bacterium]
LEEMGLIAAPHTSAGRIPTVQGYRVFVDSLVAVQRPLPTLMDSIRRDLSVEGVSPQEMLSRVSETLSSLTQLAGIVTLPKRATTTLRQIEFLPLSENRILAILVVNEHEVQNKILQTKRSYSAAELEQAGNYLTRAFSGKDIYDVRSVLLREMHDAREHLNSAMTDLIDVADKLFPSAPKEDFLLSGQANFFQFSDYSDMDQLRNLFEAFKEKRDILHILDQCLYASGVQIFFGGEQGNQVLKGCSLITSPYRVEGEVVGVLGVIGPTRIAYEKVIPVVDITAKLLGAALEFKK